jgi:hypothetical protein
MPSRGRPGEYLPGLKPGHARMLTRPFKGRSSTVVHAVRVPPNLATYMSNNRAPMSRHCEYTGESRRWKGCATQERRSGKAVQPGARVGRSR